MDHAQVLNKVLKADMQNIRSTLDELDVDAFEKAIDRIIQAPAYLRNGSARLRAPSPSSSFITCSFIFPGRYRASHSGVSDVFEQLGPHRTGTICSSAFPSPGIPARTIEAMEFARTRAARGLSPLPTAPSRPCTPTADICLNAKSDMASFVDSFAAPLSLINALIVALGPAPAAGSFRILRGHGADLEQPRRLPR